MRLLIRNAEIVTMNREEEVIFGDLLIEDGRIAEIAPQIEKKVDQTIDATGKTVIPGLIQTHIHLCQTLFRGQADDLELLDWLRKRVLPLEAAHDEESLYYSAMLGIGELISGGTTSVVDMETVHHTDAAFRAIAESGIRALSGKVMMDHGEGVPPALMEDTATSIQKSVELLEKWHNYDDGRIRYAFCPRFVVSCSEELLIQVRDLAEKYDVMIHTHASENKGEINLVEQERGMRNVLYLDKIGIASPRLILAHCVWLDDEERRVIRERGVKVSHCPGSNLKLASGYAEIPELLACDAKLSLGADGAACNNNLDMFQEMRMAALIQKPLHGPTSMPAREVFRMATIGGAEAMGLADEIGSLEVGKKADLAILDLNHFHNSPREGVDLISRLVYSAKSSDVETTIINGKIVMEKGVMKTMDKQKVLQESNRSIRRLLDRTAKEGVGTHS
ncbi:Cytosine/adenosine deaminase [Marininema mesophilum]|uniref:5-methylthioadenosine/S-adenosylhomocysteine deaminase n=2 Tax=Marininema mesophilum TaxID=1048340 RepID=A0A1H2QSZ3_9BACL|nr:Cytosine/adenosine deaminase [Marininema mesophilum]